MLKIIVIIPRGILLLSLADTCTNLSDLENKKLAVTLVDFRNYFSLFDRIRKQGRVYY